MKRAILLLGLIGTLCFAGCSSKETTEEVPENVNVDGKIMTQTSQYPLSLEELESGNYYVLHNGDYYAVWDTVTSYEVDSPPTSADSRRLAFFSIEEEKEIPTLFVNNGDKLIYYSKGDDLIDYILWERFEDMKYSIGVYNIDTMTNGRCWVDLSEDTYNVLDTCELYDVYNLKADQILLDRIGQVQLGSKHLKNGVIYNLQKGEKYDLDIYKGTQYHHYVATADTHMFSSMELFASIEYFTKQDKIYEIQIPPYFINGYYNVDSMGIVRIVFDEYYSENTEFNTPLLLVEEDEAKPVYSTIDELNKFTSNIEGSLGYVSEEEVQTPEDTEYEDILNKIQAATIMEYDLFFPEDTKCIVRIKSDETTGDCYIRTDGKTYPLKREGSEYIASFTGTGHSGTLTVSGFLAPITVEYEGCYRDR